MQNETDWCFGDDSISMAAFVQSRLSERKLRLIAAACCRHLECLAGPDWSREAIRSAELFADGLLSLEDFALARQRVLDVTGWAGDWADETSEENAARALRALMHPKAGAALREVIDALERTAHLAGTDEADCLHRSRKELLRQAILIREIVGNPYRPLTLPLEWRTWHGQCLPRLAREIYDTRTFQDIPILGDMLEDAGCQNEDLLIHCREETTHALGCWLLDALLGRV